MKVSESPPSDIFWFIWSIISHPTHIDWDFQRWRWNYFKKNSTFSDIFEVELLSGYKNRSFPIIKKYFTELCVIRVIWNKLNEDLEFFKINFWSNYVTYETKFQDLIIK